MRKASIIKLSLVGLALLLIPRRSSTANGYTSKRQPGSQKYRLIQKNKDTSSQ